MSEFQVTYNPHWAVGEIIQVEGKSWKITKKTTTALAVTRYYWFDRLLDRWFKKECDTCS